ncbi:Glycine--tRNA ligase beta subunit [Candidatus Magnetaquicoccaceae bacterium FCR-1]|uniref:Glycine--tRNA ligase beta subunit n=1 Tax=Candidatus Magnetaquiglobus chichijimensis TaxID=3141448 RepID=A0ABQ0C4R1_9PROT
MSDLLWEIGCEEIPARMLGEAIRHFGEATMAALNEAGLTDGATRLAWCDGTPRRLALAVTGIAARQADREETKRGPALERAFDAQGNPTKATEGFAQSCGATVADLERLQTPKGAYLAYTIRQAGSPATGILPKLMAGILAAFPWPKSMRWGSGQTRFVRPIRWMVVLLDGQVLEARASESVMAGNQTRGHRFMAPGPFTVTDEASYRATLAANRVMLSLDARSTAIRDGVTRLAEAEGGQAWLDAGLIQENAGLTEWPLPMLGRFDPIYLEIPPEVLSTSMKHHQKYFPVQGPDGALKPCFVAVANLDAPDPSVLVRGYERVLRARLEDAAFYWREDRNIPLPERLPALDKVVFQARLGTVGEKARRIATLAGALAERLDPDAKPLAERAALLAKCDLVTGMVGEFPELQGIMGGYYARHAGESEPVARAIQEHYRPQGAGDDLPASRLGRLVSLADKLDTLVGCFGIGLVPTGTKDPFALRRAALGVIRMLLDGEGMAVALRPLLELAHAGFAPGVLERNAATTAQELLEFIHGRLEGHLKRDFAPDLIEAVEVLRLDDLTDVVARIEALRAFKTRESFPALVAANKRIANILGKAPAEEKGHAVTPAALREEAESALHAEVTRVTEAIAPLLAGRQYDAALENLAGLRGSIDRFFDALLVMDPDAAVRRNRLALLGAIRAGFSHLADFSRLALPDNAG